MTTQAHGSRQTVFTIIDPGLAALAPDLFGIWATEPPTLTPVSFALGGAAGMEAPRWRANLPADFDAAHACLASGERGLAAVSGRLDGATERMEACVARSLGPVAFAAAPPGGALAEPEAHLLAILNGVEPSPLVFALGGGLEGLVGSAWVRAVERFQTSLQSLQQGLASFGWIETRVGGELIGRTVVAISGAAHTIWRPRPTPQQMALHQHMLRMALNSRIALLRTFAIVAQGAARLTPLLAPPAGPLLALPAAWTFVTQVLAEKALV